MSLVWEALRSILSYVAEANVCVGIEARMDSFAAVLTTF
jgi:hypothetical protein